MHKLIKWITFLSFPVVFPLYAETTIYESDRNPVSLGVHAGVNFETARTPTDISTETHTGFSVGATGEFVLGPNFSIAPELNYSRRGLNILDSGGVRANVFYHSLELPVFAKISFGEQVRPFVFVGPMGVWNISNEVQGTIGGTTASSSFNPRTFDFAAVGGAGLEAGAFFADVRYILGIVDISESSGDWQSRGFRLMAGLKI